MIKMHTPIATLKETPANTHNSHFFLISLNVNIHSYRYIKLNSHVTVSASCSFFFKCRVDKTFKLVVNGMKGKTEIESVFEEIFDPFLMVQYFGTKCIFTRYQPFK